MSIETVRNDVVARRASPKRAVSHVARAAESLSVECLRSARSFNQLCPIWQTLERLDPTCTPFNTWSWNHLWWQHYATAQDRLALLIVRQERRVVAIAPLYLQGARVCQVMPIKVLRFIGSGGGALSDYLNIIALPAQREAAVQAIMQYLPQIRGWQKLQLTDMVKGAVLAKRVGKFVLGEPGVALKPKYHVIHKAALPDSFESYCAQLSGERRKQIKEGHDQLNDAGKSELCICASREELAEALDALFDLHRLRQGGKREASGFHSVTDEKFHRAVIEQFFAADALWLVTLKLDEKVIGVHYIFVWRGELLFVQSAYSPEHEAPSLDYVLFIYLVRRGIEQGMTGLDVLKGHHADKALYAKDKIRTVDIAYVRPGVRALFESVRDRLVSSREANS